jgi:hypothetical protein
MAQISRPFQVALAAVALLALIWVVALHRPGGSGGSSSSGQPSTASATSGKAAGGSPSGGGSSTSGARVYHGSAPGVEGLSRAIAKAHGAVATSQQNAKELAEKSAQASSNAASAPAHTAPASTTHAKSVAPAVPATKKAGKTAPKPAPHHAAVNLLARQRLVEGELKQGKVVVLLFWSSKGSDDVAVRNSLRQLSGRDRHIAVHLATPGQVATFGSITRGVQVYGTPTILFVGKHGHTIVLNGLQDAYAIRQAVSDARHA